MKISDVALIIGGLAAVSFAASTVIITLGFYVVALTMMVVSLLLYGVAEYVQEGYSWGHPL